MRSSPIWSSTYFGQRRCVPFPPSPLLETKYTTRPFTSPFLKPNTTSHPHALELHLELDLFWAFRRAPLFTHSNPSLQPTHPSTRHRSWLLVPFRPFARYLPPPLGHLGCCTPPSPLPHSDPPSMSPLCPSPSPAAPPSLVFLPPQGPTPHHHPAVRSPVPTHPRRRRKPWRSSPRPRRRPRRRRGGRRHQRLLAAALALCRARGTDAGCGAER
jgi:hypothetical protein